MPGSKVYVLGRLRGLTLRRLNALALANGLALTRRPSAAGFVVLAHGAAGVAVSNSGELRLGLRLEAHTSFLSERTFRVKLGLLPGLGAGERPYSADQMASHAGLTTAQTRTLSLFDVLNPCEDGFSYADLATARAVGKLIAAGVGFPRIIAAALALDEKGERLSSARLAEAPWGELVRAVEGGWAQCDGQLLLPLEGEDLDAEEAFARAEASEAAGDLASARRWYELAGRLDAADAVIPFNLGNVLDELGLPREAELAYRQAIARAPDFADAWFNLGVLNEKRGREADALLSYQKAFTVEPTYADALHNAALLLIRRRCFARALALLERIVAQSGAGGREARRLAQLCRMELKHEAAQA
ncbi:MAG: tetratricopeptide repeat protein [Hyphomicrobiales bacterium]|nr:tetratricopeptide repeat protein [Hyphomicrobiales bacterium]